MQRPGSERDSAGAWQRRPACVRLALATVVALTAWALSGCTSISEKFRNVASEMPAVGLPAGAPERPAQAVPFPAVHDVPPPRNSTTLTDIERAQAEKDLVAARDGQQTKAGISTQAQKRNISAAAAAKTAPKPIPTSTNSASSATIY
jgi:hypothetical protein